MNYLQILNIIRIFIKEKIPSSLSPKFFEFENQIKSLFYIGSNYYCPICNGQFRKFLPSQYREGLNIVCPRCQSLERHRLLFLYLKMKTNFFKNNLKVLHFGPAHCLERIFKKLDNLKYITADLQAPNAMIKMDITDIKFQDNIFDVILCSHVLEHVVDDQKAMAELFRVLKPGGWAIIQVPIEYNRAKSYEDNKIKTPIERKQVFGKDDHVRIYGLDFLNRLKTAGFNVKEDNFVFSLDKHVIVKYKLDIDEKINFCTK